MDEVKDKQPNWTGCMLERSKDKDRKTETERAKD